MEMKNLYYDTIEELASDVFFEYENLEDEKKDIAIIAKYEEARELVKEFMCLDFNIVEIDGLGLPDFNGYNDEFTIALTAIDNEYELWCYPSKSDGKYLLKEGATSIYVLDNCCSKILDYLNAENMYEVSISDEDGYLCACDECGKCKEELTSTSPTPIATSTASYSVNGVPVTYEVYQKYEKVIENKLKKFEQEMDLFRRMIFGL